MNKQKKDTYQNNPREESKNGSQGKFGDLIKELRQEVKFFNEKNDSFIKNMPKEGICYLFSALSIKNWKEYVDYDNMVKNSKVINLKHQKKPEKINDELINRDKDLLSYPDIAQPCAIVLKEGIAKDRDFILVNQELWEYFEKKYSGIAIKRNYAKVGQNDIIFTNELKIVNLILVYNSYLEQLENKNLEYLKQYRLQIPSDILLKDFKVLIRKALNKANIFKISINQSSIRIWKRDPSLDTNEKIRNHLYNSCKSSKGLDYQISNQGELLDQDDAIPMNLIISDSEPLIIEINEPGKIWVFYNDKIKAYKKCDYCGKIESSEFTCSCGKVFYCSEMCKYDHKLEHSKHCEKAYDSDDNKEIVQKEGSSNGLCGLDNLGNTCYMNSALQCLSNCRRLVDYFLTDAYKGDINEKNPLGSKGKMVKKFAFLIKKLWLDNLKSFSPHSFKLAMSKFQTYFHGYTQHDPNEFLIYLLDGLHEDLNRIKDKPLTQPVEQENKSELEYAKECWDVFMKRNDSVITDLMYGQYRSTIECLACNYTSLNFETFSICSIPIPNQKEVEIFYINDDYSMKPSRVLFRYPDEKYSLSQLHTDFLALLDKKDKKTVLAIGNLETISKVDDLSEDVINVVAQKLQNSYLLIFEFSEKPTTISDNESIYVGLKSSKIDKKGVSNSLGVIRMLKVEKNISNSDLYLRVLEKYRHIINFGWDSLSLQSLQNISSEECYKELRKRYKDCLQLYLINKKDPKERNLILFNNEVTKLSQDDILQMEISDFPDFYPFEMLKGFLRIDPYKKKTEKEDMDQTRRIINLTDCLQRFRDPEELDENNCWYCKKCQKHQMALKKLEIYKAPDIFGIQLKRFKGFENTRWNRKESKIEDLVTFPIAEFDFSPYIINKSSISAYGEPNQEESKDDSKLAVYDLFAVLHHTGTLNNGHCYAHCKNSETGDWYLYNDEKVIKINAIEEIVSETAYVLFYKRKGIS